MIRRFFFLLFFFLISGIAAFAQIGFESTSSVKYLKGKDAAGLPANWMSDAYDDSGWLNGSMPFRYGAGGVGGTILGDMKYNYSTVYFRAKFTALQISKLKEVFFPVNFNDGFIIWINGQEVFSYNAPTNPTNTSVAIDQHRWGTFENYSLPVHDVGLKEGENQLAVQAFNINAHNTDFYFAMGLSAEIPLPQTSDSLKVVFSQTSGFYSDKFDLKLESPDQAFQIQYTIDGSNPQTSATSINGGSSKTLTIDPLSTSGRPKTPCFIVRASLKKEGFSPSFPVTKTFIFLDQVLNQSYPGGNWPNNGTVNGQRIDIDMDPNITKSTKYGPLMKGAMTDIPSISVVTELKDLFDPTTGIYVNAGSHGENWERFSSVEMIDPSGNPGFYINAGLRIRGGWSRHGDYPKHAFRLFFRKEYGAPKLKFPLFDSEGTNEFDKVDLRCEQNYSWAHPSDDKARNTAVREVFSRDTQHDMGRPYTRSRYYHLYLNGMYWGLYQTEERPEARYAASYIGGSPDDYDVVKVNTENYNYVVEATDGNLNSWQKIYNMSIRGFASNADYFALEGKDQYGNPKKGGEVILNIDNLIDYMLVIFYTGNFDSPTTAFGQNAGPNNFFAIDKRDDRSMGFDFFVHDAEHSLMIGPEGPGIGIQENRVQIPNMSISGLYGFHPQWLHYKLTSNKEYCQRVADRVYKSFFNNGVFTPDACHLRFQKRAEQITKAIIGESARWGDAQRAIPYTFDDWNTEINDIYARYFPARGNIVLTQLQNAGLYASFDPPVFTKDNVRLDREVYTVNGTGTYQLGLSSATGQIYYTIDGSDPRMVGGQVNKSAMVISSGGTVTLGGTAVINARVKSGDSWSALASVKFLDTNEDYSSLKVTELHYHPADSLAGTEIISGKSFEFIELKNTGTRPINLGGLSFTSSIHYQFKETDVLAPQQFYVIASKPKWFYERHFMVPSGKFSSNFSNSGEQVVISKTDGSPVVDFIYSDIVPWATKPDGGGPSLTSRLRNPTGDPSDPLYWGASTVYDGTPFADDPGIVNLAEKLAMSGNSVILFPNPTNGLLYLKPEEPNSNVQVKIYSLSGSLIYHASMVGNTVIDLGGMHISPGIYLVNTKCNESNSVHKVSYQP